MNQFYLTDHFLKQLKSYSKKFPNIGSDLTICLQNFSSETAQYLGQKLFKVRLKSSDIHKGKNKSFRIVILFWHSPDVVVPITIYFKGDIDNLSKNTIKYHLSQILNELKSNKIF